MFSQGSGGSSPLIRTKRPNRFLTLSGHKFPQATQANQSQENQQNELRLVANDAEQDVSIDRTTGNHEVPFEPIMVRGQRWLKMLFG
jgi:hypothetical protein